MKPGNALPERFAQYLQQLGVSQTDSILIAVSGGVDSVVLTRLFYLIGQKIALAHVNFGLRGAESDGDEAFVAALATELNAPFYTTRFDTAQEAESSGESIQMVARRLRYAWLADLKSKFGFDHVAIGHQLDDQAETLLLHLLRGAGPSGLQGMHALNGNEWGPLLRPLLFVSRNEIESFALSQKIVWREDASNQSDDYQRNAIRLKVFPILKALNPTFLEAFEHTAEQMTARNQNYQFLLQSFVDTDGAFPLKIGISVVASAPQPEYLLRDILRPFGFDVEQTRQIWSTREETGKSWTSSNGVRLLNNRGNWMLEREAADKPEERIQIEENDLMIRLPEGGALMFMPTQIDAEYPAPKEGVLVDADRLKWPLFWRNWRPGDAFQPLGMGGKSQKLQDFLTNNKLSLFEKERVRLLVNGDEQIIWVAGLRLSESFRRTPQTRRLIKIIRS